MLFQIGYVAAGFYFIAGMPKFTRLTTAILLTQMIAPLILSLMLLATKSRSVHYVGIGLLFVVMLIHYGRVSIN